MILWLEITGGLLVLLAALHIGFPRYFRWREDLARVSLINREMMYIHTFFLAFVVLLIGMLCLLDATDLAHTPIGHKIDLGLAVFWMIRLLAQFFGYSPALWRGKRFETRMHVLFSILWAYLTVIFLLAGS